MDFSIVPDILKNATPKAERPWTLKQMGELLKITYDLTDHPILKNWMDYEPIDIFMLAMKNREKFQRFNRTLVERTIWQSQHYSQFELDHGVLTMRSKGIEYSILHVEAFQLNANKFYGTGSVLPGNLSSTIYAFRLTGAGHLEASMLYFMTVCNDLIALTYRHAIMDKLLQIEDENEKVKYLLREKANLHQLQDQFEPKVFKAIMDTIDIELGYYKNVREYLGISLEIKAVLDQFLAERNARIYTAKLLSYLLEDNIAEFCNNLSELVLRVFSYYDLGGEEPEKVYHYFLLGVLTGFKDYQIESNKESGKGRFDILLIPDTLDYKGVVIEVKRSMTDKEEAIQGILNEALQQITDNQYSIELKKRGHKKFIGIAAVFYSKKLFLKYHEYTLV
jgi:hypothetical protein